MPNITTSEECLKCEHCILVEESKAKVWIDCSAKEKRIFYGKIVECDNFQKKKEGTE